MATGYNFGVDAEEVVLTLVGFASQHEIFSLMELKNLSDLGWVAYTFGLIGFLLLLLLPASWNFKTIASWFLLFLIVIVRPLGEPLFFSDAASVAQSALDSQYCPGGITDTVECEGINAQQGNEGSSNTRLSRYVQGQLDAQGFEGDGNGLSFKVYSPEAAAIDVLNDLNYALSVGLHDLGPRSLERHFAAIETIRRSSASNAPTAYNVSEFLATCGRRLPAAAEVAYMRTEDIETQRPELLEQMENTSLTAADGVLLYQNYANYVRGMEIQEAQDIYPTLICGPENCSGNNAYSYNIRDRRVDTRDFKRGLEPLLYEDAYEGMDSDVAEEFEGQEGVDLNRLIRQQLVGQTLQDLERSIGRLGDDAFTKLENQPVSLVVPLNVNSSSQNALIQTSGLTNANGDAASNGFNAFVGGCAAGAASVAIGAGSVGTFIAPGAGTLIGGVIGGIVGCVGGGLLSAFAWGGADDSNLDQDMLIQPVADSDAGGFIVSNCRDMHRVIDLRVVMSTQSAQQFGVDLQALQEDPRYEDAFDPQDPDFAALPPRAQTHTILTTALQTAQFRCARNRYGSSATDAQIDNCTDTETDRIQSMMVLSRNLVAENSQPLAQNMVQQASTPEFQSPFRNLLADVGGAVSGIGVAFKSAIGGFSAGTYSKIMPMVVAYATVIMIILTPIIYMIGLAIPSWAFGIFFMPLVVIVYFQLTKIVFTMIGVINGIFLATNDRNILSGNMIDFADLVMGFAYTSAFILTGFFMFALKNPVGAIQQVAGTADKTSTISGGEALAMAFSVAKAGKMVGAAPKALASGIGAAKGASAAAGASGAGGLSKGLSALSAGVQGTLSPASGATPADAGQNAFDEAYTRQRGRGNKVSMSDAQKQRASAAEGRWLKAEDDRMADVAKAGKYGKYAKDRMGTAINMVGDQPVEMAKQGGAKVVSGELSKAGVNNVHNRLIKGFNDETIHHVVEHKEVAGTEKGSSHAVDFNIKGAQEHLGFTANELKSVVSQELGHFVDKQGNKVDNFSEAYAVRFVEATGIPLKDKPPSGGK
ncbi:MAG: hypothetical protein CMF62_09990 [Magnetococcales bacterium]|nr:hypothetical protein [Magnetococcales bacterium]